MSGAVLWDAGAAPAGPRSPTACITLDLESDFCSRLPTAYAGWEPERVEALLSVLDRYQVPLTVFVVGQAVRAKPDVIERLRGHGAEFHLHSFSHDLANPDSAEEIRRGRQLFEEFFGSRPEGYRAPEGRISPAGWERLEGQGFLFDSSVFPSFWPRPHYLKFPRRPFHPTGLRLLEVPLATVTPLRLIVSLSWMKLLGWPLYRWLLQTRSLSEPLVVNMHLHDLWALPALEQLALPWRLIFGRNRRRGLAILESFLGLLARRGYTFRTLGAVVRDLQASGTPC